MSSAMDSSSSSRFLFYADRALPSREKAKTTRLNISLDYDFPIKTSNCRLSGTLLSNAQSDPGVFTTYADIKGMPGITRKLKGAVIDKN
jgi:hypothetical protein